MGLIKKLLGRELVGWSQLGDTEIYPITHVGAVFDDTNTSLDSILLNILLRIADVTVGNNKLPINYLWAYTVAANDAAALSLLNQYEHVDVPTNYRDSSTLTVPDGSYIYMTTARKLGNTYLSWTDGTIWSTPLRIGTGTTSSYTGNDGNGYNYIYCRTIDGTAPSKPINLTVANIEALPEGYGIAVDGSTSNAAYNVWYDHPLGVSELYQYEWIAIAQGNDGQGWSLYSNPTLWSRFGVDGKDSEGIEYIFITIAEDAPVPLFIGNYNGRIGEHGTEYRNVPIDTCTSNEFYQHDDFIPSGWHDLPQSLTLDHPRQYVSVRKRKFVSGGNSYWDAFSEPVLWAKLASPSFTVQISNESTIIGDTDNRNSIRQMSYNSIKVYDGEVDITNDRKYVITIEGESVNSIDSLFKLCLVDRVTGTDIIIKDNEDPEYVAGKGFSYLYTVSELYNDLGLVFCLDVVNPDAELPANAYGVDFRVKVYYAEDTNHPVAEIVKTQPVLIVSKSGVLTRLRGMWESGNHYCYKTFDGSGPNDKHIVYVDIVEYNGHYYQCTLTHDSLVDNAPTSATGASLWRAADEYEFIATKVLVAETAAIEVLNGGSLVVHNDVGTIVGGLTGGTEAATNDVIIWAGSTFENFNNAPFRVYEDGSFVARKATITGTINADDGTIGGFKIGSNYIESVEGAYDGSTTGSNSIFFLHASGSGFLGYSSNQGSTGYKWAGIGLNCLSVTVGASAMLRIEDTCVEDTPFSFNKFGAYINMKGAHLYDDMGYTNVALYIAAGKICGFRPAVKRLGSSKTLSKMDFFICVVADGVTLNLPSDPEEGLMYMIQCYGRTVSLTASDPDKILNGDGSLVTSRDINGRDLHFLLYDKVNKLWTLGWSNV